MGKINIINAIFKRRKSMKIKFLVPGMSCSGCVETIKNSLNNLRGINKIVINLKSKEVLVDSELPPEEIEKAIEEVGYEVTKREIMEK